MCRRKWESLQLDVKHIYFHEINLSVAKRVVNGSQNNGDVAIIVDGQTGMPMGVAFLTKANSPKWELSE